MPTDSALSGIFDNKTVPSVNTCCSNCVILNLKLEEISSELSSAREIIKLLQEENCSTQNVTINPRVPQPDCGENYSWTEIPTQIGLLANQAGRTQEPILVIHYVKCFPFM